MPTLIEIAGPTATGKTALAIRLAQLYQTAVLSADSRQLYRHLNIGTNKPTVQELARVPHYFIDILEPSEAYNAARFGEAARQLLQTLFLIHDAVILAGGTGFYIQALEQSFDAIPEVDPNIRAALRQAYQQQGLAPLLTELQAHDPATWQTIDRANPQRVLRALEVWRSTGRPISGFRQGVQQPLPFSTIKIGLELPRAELYARIDARVDQMMTDGLLAEVESLLSRGYDPTLNALQTIGYREMIAHLQGETSLDEAIALLKQNTRRYAKRQLTWFRRDATIQWFAPDADEAIVAYIEKVKSPPPN